MSSRLISVRSTTCVLLPLPRLHRGHPQVVRRHFVQVTCWLAVRGVMRPLVMTANVVCLLASAVSTISISIPRPTVVCTIWTYCRRLRRLVFLILVLRRLVLHPIYFSSIVSPFRLAIGFLLALLLLLRR